MHIIIIFLLGSKSRIFVLSINYFIDSLFCNTCNINCLHHIYQCTVQDDLLVGVDLSVEDIGHFVRAILRLKQNGRFYIAWRFLHKTANRQN